MEIRKIFSFKKAKDKRLKEEGDDEIHIVPASLVARNLLRREAQKEENSSKPRLEGDENSKLTIDGSPKAGVSESPD